MIVSAQRRGGYDEKDARWHHAAIYIGRGKILEAVVSGVRVWPLAEYIGPYCIRVRRGAALAADKANYDLVIAAMGEVRKPYSLIALPKLALNALQGFWRPKTFAEKTPATICSEIYHQAYQTATGQHLFGPSFLAKPYDLSLTTKLHDVSIDWLTIE
jgi:cell wall-associated NlpC family hydrolase